MAKEKKVEKKEESKGSLLKIVVVVITSTLITSAVLGAAYIYAMKNTTLLQNNAALVANKVVQPPKSPDAVEASDKVFAFKDEFVLNLADDGGKKIVKTIIAIGYSNSKLDKELQDKTSITRDVITSILRSKKTTDFDEKGVVAIKKQILDGINPIFKNGKVENIYMSDTLIQY